MTPDARKKPRSTLPRQRARTSEAGSSEAGEEADAASDDAPLHHPEPQETQAQGQTQDGEPQDSGPSLAEPDDTLHSEQQDTTMDAIREHAQMTQQSYEKIFGSTREQLEKASQTAMKTAEEMQKLSKDNFEACVQASTIVARGLQEVGRAWAAYVQESLAQSAAATKALLSARSLQEAVSLQSEWAKSSFDKLFAETTKLSEQSVKLANEAIEPINARISVTVEKLRVPLAA